jgi:hypothetical protein
MAIAPAPNVHDDWSPELRSELETHAADPLPGTRLPPGGERARNWEFRLAPDQRLAFQPPRPLAPGQRA